MPEKLILAYSGGLDTSVAVRWLKEERGYDIVAVTVDVGMQKDRETLQSRALAAGAVAFHWAGVQAEFVRDFIFPALTAGVIYEGQYPLATALGRPLIAQKLVEVARQEGATAVGHGSTGKGNDQVRFDVSVQALAPDLRIVAPVREWGMNREDEIAYAQKHQIPVPVTKESPYSIDENLWGRAIECGVLEDPWAEPPEDVYEWTKSAAAAPDEAGLRGDRLPAGHTGEPGRPRAGRRHAHRPAGGDRRRARRGAHRPPGEPPGGHQVARDIRGAGGGDAAAGASGAGADVPFEGAGAAEGAHRAGVRRPDLQRPLVHRPPRGPGGLRAQHSAPRDRQRAGAAAQGVGGGGRAQVAQELV